MQQLSPIRAVRDTSSVALALPFAAVTKNVSDGAIIYMFANAGLFCMQVRTPAARAAKLLTPTATRTATTVLGVGVCLRSRALSAATGAFYLQVAVMALAYLFLQDP